MKETLPIAKGFFGTSFHQANRLSPAFKLQWASTFVLS